MPRLLGLDFGTRRVGAAISDSRGEIASPFEVYELKGDRANADHYRALVEAEQIDRIVVGLPLRSRGEEGESARRAREFGAWLEHQTGRAVAYFDERFTTVEAEELMRSAGLKAKARRDRRDMLAAQLLLQAYIDAGSPAAPRAAPLDDDS